MVDIVNPGRSFAFFNEHCQEQKDLNAVLINRGLHDHTPSSPKSSRYGQWVFMNKRGFIAGTDFMLLSEPVAILNRLT